MKEARARMLANAGLIAGLALGSIAIANAATPALSTPAADVRAAATSTTSPVVAEDSQDRSRRTTGLTGLVADLAQMDVRDVEWQLRAGQSLGAVARSKGIQAEALVAAALRGLSMTLDGDVASGRISASQRARVLADAEAGIGARLDVSGAVYEMNA